MKVKIKRVFAPQTLICGLIILFFGFIAFLFPYSGDDWAWGSEIGISRLEIFFDNYNGRYLGNLLVMILTRSKAVKVIMMALCYFLSCLLCQKYSGSKKTGTLIFAVFLFLLMPRYTFAQSVVWTSGFTNYVPSALISAGYLLIIKNITGQETPRYPRFLFLATLVMGFVGAPFMENIALFNICLGIAVIGYTFLKFKSFYLTHISFLAGAVAGALWMFSNTAYRAVASGEDTYRTAATDLEGIWEQALTNIEIICFNIFTNNIGICIVASLLLIVLVVGFVKKSDVVAKKATAISLLILNIACLVPNLCIKIGLLLGYDGTHYPVFMNSYIFKVLCMVVFALTTLGIVLLCVTKGRRFYMALPLYCIPVVVAPLLVVTPIGPRCFFIAHLLLMVFLTSLLSYILEDVKIPVKRVFCGCVTVALLVQVIYYMNVFIPVYKYDVKRNELAQLQSQNKEKTIVLCELPDEGYVWCDSLKREPWPHRYKLFHQLDENIPVVMVSTEEFDEYYEQYISK